MAEREAIDLDSNITRKMSAGEMLTPDELKHIKAKRVEVLGRSFINANLLVNQPAHMHGEWVPNDPVEIHRKQSLGYSIATTSDGFQMALNPGHSDGTGKLIVGDVVYMVTPKVNQQIIESIRAEEFQEMHGSKDGKERAEREFANTFNNSVDAVHGKAVVESRSHVVDGKEIESTTSKK